MSNIPQPAHTVGVEAGIGLPELANKLAKVRLRPYPGTNTLMPGKAWKFTLGRVLPRSLTGPLGRLLGAKALGVPLVGPAIDLLTSSESIATHSDEKRMLRMAGGGRHVKVEQGVQYEDGAVYFPESRTWSFLPTELTLSNTGLKTIAGAAGLAPKRSRPAFDWKSKPIPPPYLQHKFQPDRPGEPGWGLEVKRSRPSINWKPIPPPELQRVFQRDRPGEPGWGLEVRRSRPAFDWNSSRLPPRDLQRTFRADRPGQPGWGLEVSLSPRPPAGNFLRSLASGLR